MGTDRTAVLVNGRRVPGNPWTGTSAVDINTIPMAAVDRGEILTDSASAVYGADAIGGVVNIIMKDDWEGAEVYAGGSRPTRDSANTDNIGFSFGTTYDRGSIVFSGEWYRKMPVFDRDRDYSNVQVNGSSGPNGLPVDGSLDVQGINGGGNSLFSLDFSQALGYPGTCDYAGLTPVDSPFGVPGVGCGFGYADYSMQNAGIERRATITTADYQINDNLEAFIENRFVNNKSIGRFAPAIGGFFFSQDSAQNTLGQDAILYHRFVGHGTRDDQGKSHEIDTTLGLRGNLFDEEVNFEVYYRDYRMNATDEGKNYILSSIIENLVENDEYNVGDPFAESNADAIALSRASVNRDISTVWEGFGITLDGSLNSFELAGGAIGWAAGAETALESYADEYDSYREAGNVIGSAGNSSAGGRSRQALFGEVQLPILDSLIVQVAGRYDDYNDFGSEFSPQISGRWQPTDWLTFRASWGEGFKAPNLTDMYSLAAQDFPGVADVVRCRAQGIADADCPSGQIESFTGGNPELQAETSESTNFGVVVEPLAGLRLALDWWNIELDDAITQVDESDILEMEYLGSLPSGVYVNRGASSGGVPGPISRCEGSGLSFPNCGLVNVNANLALLEVEGVDFRARYDFETDFGNFTAIGNWSNLRKYNETLPVIGKTEHAGTTQYPENTAKMTLRWGIDAFTLSYVYQWIDSHSDATYDFDEYDTHDLNLVWDSPWGSQVSLGVRNLTDEDPVIETNSGWNSTTSRYALELYSVAGRMYSASIRHSF